MAKSKNNKSKTEKEKSVINNNGSVYEPVENNDSINKREETIKLLDEKTKYQIGALFAKNWNLQKRQLINTAV